MSDRDLLEWAAKAAGVEVYESTDGTLQNRPILVFAAGGGMGTMPYEERWNPLVDDAQAMRLAISCGLSIEPYPYYSETKHSVIVKQRRRGDQMRETNPTEVVEVYGDYPAAATRLAIVRAAASIGQSQESGK